MSTKFNESTSSELVKNLDYQEDKTLKWKSLVNNTYAKKDNLKRNKNRKKDGEDSVDDKSLIQQQVPSCPSESKAQTIPDVAGEETAEKSEVMESPESSKASLIIDEKFGNVKEKKIVIDDDLHTREQTAAATSTHTVKASDDEKNISTNLPQLNANSQAIESTKATTVTSSTVITDKKSDDNTVMSKVEGVSVALSDDDKRLASKQNSNSKTIDKTTSPRTLRSNRNISSTTPTLKQQQPPPPPQQIMSSDDKNKNDETTIKSDLDENEAANEDSSATNDTTQSSSLKKTRGRVKVGLEANESESDLSQKRGRRLRSIMEIADEKKNSETHAAATEDVETKKETEVEKEETPKRRGRSRKLIEDEKSSELQNEESQHQIETKVESQDQVESETEPKKKRGRLGKKDSIEDNKSEVSASDDVKPRLLMTINLTDKSAVPKIMTNPTPPVDDLEKTAKKRGRRPKATSITKPIQVKKSLRLAKDGADANVSESVSVRKDPPILAPPIGRIRSQRRIKPTAKILANEELRQGFEVTNCKRLSLSNENLMESLDRSPTMKSSGNETPNNKSPVVSSPEKSPKEVYQEPEPSVILAPVKKPPSLKSRDPQDFINEIKSFKIGTNRSPEDSKRLTKSQQKRMIKAKEKHLGLLGLRPKNGHSDSSNESSTSDDFVPTKPSRARPAITLRLRNQRAAEILKHKANQKRREQEKRMKLLAQAPEQMEIDMSDDCVVVESGNKENSNINFVCSCHQKTKYCISQSDAFVTNGKMFCCAIDEIESRKIGCTNELTESVINLFRPSVKVSYMALCLSHKKRLVSHNCCSGCGVFCTQGSFVICSNKHFFHRNCATKYILNTPYEPNNPNFTGPTLLLKCPHCGIDAPEFDYRVTMRCENLPVFVQHRSSTVPKPAKMGNMLRHPQHNHQIQLNSLSLNIDKLIPENVAQILRAASDRLKSQHASSSDLPTFAPKDIFYAIYRKDGDERMAEIVTSGYNLLTPLKDFHNGTCLHLVSNFGSLTMTYLILSRANSHNFVNLMDKEMRTPIMYSVAGKKHDILKLLCQCGADVTLKGPDGMTVLHLAAKSGNITATQIILENYRQVATISKLQKFINTTDDGHWTAMVWAAENGHGEIVSYLISLGADPNICDSENNTVLHWACLAGKLEAIYPLVTNCDLGIQNIHGDTALHISARQAKTKICMLLMAHGASLTVRNLANETPLDITDDKSECAKLLKFNMELRQIGIGGWKPSIGEKTVLCNDVSNGREVYPIQIVKKLQSSSQHDDTILPDFKYITKNILLQNSIQIDQRISQMRVCSCSDNCISDNCQCAQISLQNWYNIDGRLIANFNYADPPMLFECNDVCQCNKLLCKNRVVQNGVKFPLVVFECDDKNKGFGVKCLIKIRKGSFVAQYTGEILTDQEADRRTDDSYFFDLGASDHCIDANFYGNVSRFFNHSCSSNIVPVRVYFEHQDLRFPKIAFFASRDIEAGEEIAFDYGEKFWMIKYKYFKCTCRSDKCRYSAETIDRTVAEFNQRNGAINN